MSSKALVTLASVLLTAGAALAQTRVPAPSAGVIPALDGYLRIDGITGDSRVAGYTGWFDLKEWLIGTETTPPGGTRRPSLSTLVVRGAFTSALPQLFLNANLTSNIPTVRLDVLSPGPTGPVLVHTLTLTGVRLLQIVNNVETVADITLEFEATNSATWLWKNTPSDVTYTWSRTALGSSNFRMPTLSQPVADGAEYTALMQVPGVNGGSTRAGYIGWIPVSNFGADVLRDLPAAGTNAGPSVSELKCNVFLGRALPELIRNVAAGTIHPEVKLHVFAQPTDTRPILEMRLFNAAILGVSDYGGVNGGACHTTVLPMSMEWAYIDAAGRRVTGCWNFAMRRGC